MSALVCARAAGLATLCLFVVGSTPLRGSLPEAQPPASSGPAVLGVPDRTNAHVSLAAEGPFVVATWSAASPKGSTDIYAAASVDAGGTFSRPQRVNSTEGDASVNGEQPPRAVLIGRRGTSPSIVVVWTAKGPQGTRLLSARSDDGGRTFTKTSIVPGSDAAGDRGWESAAVDAQAGVRTLWLDHRNMAANGAASHAGHGRATGDKTDGVAMAQRSQLYLATIGDPASARPLTSGVCYCCKTALAAGPDGSLYAAWRHVYPGNLRDIAFTASHDGGRTFAAPVRISEDKWTLDGCPDDGPAMAVDASGQVHVVWPTLVGGGTASPSIGIFYARSRDGKTFTPRERLATTGVAHHPQIAVAGTAIVLTWDELVEGGRRVVFAKGVEEQGRLRFTRLTGTESARGIYPSLVATAAGVLGAWTTGGDASKVHVQRVMAR